MLRSIDSIVTAVNRWVAHSLAAVGAVICAPFAIMLTVVIIGRAFGWSVVWLEEYTAYFMLVVSCLGLAYAAMNGAHIRINFVVKYLPERVRFILERVCMAVSILWVIFLTKTMYSWFSSALVAGSRSILTATPDWIPSVVLVIGLGGLALATLVLFLHLIMQRVK